MNPKKIILLILFLAAMAAIVYYQENKDRVPANQIVLYGNVDIRQVDINFQVFGRVTQMPHEEGDFVTTGTLLGVLDKTPYKDQVREAQANVDSISVNLKNANRVWQRRQELIDEGGVSEEDLENMLASKLSLEANLEQAEAALALAKTNLNYTEVFAPTNGTILTRVREPGTVVNVGDPIYVLSVESPVWIRAFVAEPDLGLVFPGMKAEVHTDTPGGKVYTGYVGFISPVAEFTPKTVETTRLRTDLVYRLRIYADNPDQGLRQGMPVTVYLQLDQNK